MTIFSSTSPISFTLASLWMEYNPIRNARKKKKSQCCATASKGDSGQEPNHQVRGAQFLLREGVFKGKRHCILPADTKKAAVIRLPCVHCFTIPHVDLGALEGKP